MSTKSSLPFTSVVSLHQDEYTCGVAKFGKQLARRLGIPFVALSPFPEQWGSFPLLSLKWSELSPDHHLYTRHYCYPDLNASLESGSRARAEAASKTYAVFWHDTGDPYLIEHAQMNYFGDPSLGPNGLWCPSLIPKAPPRPLRLFAFGMAGRLQKAYYERLRLLLEWQGLEYHLRVSVGLHEGTSLSVAHQHFDDLRDILGYEHVTALGILSDEAVALEVRDCDYVVQFFDKGARANNTTLQTAMAAHRDVITNHDAQTPGFIKASTRNIETLEGWPGHPPFYYSWERLVERMTELYGATVANR